MLLPETVMLNPVYEADPYRMRIDCTACDLATEIPICWTSGMLKGLGEALGTVTATLAYPLLTVLQWASSKRTD